MNERMLKLARLAQGKNPADYEPDDNVIIMVTSDVEKFAELIVRECIMFMYMRNIQGFGILEERNLKEHFGVKE